jgi:hypothetical protein
VICKLCNRPLKDKKSQMLEVGPKCKKKLKDQGIEVEDLKINGWDTTITKSGLQLTIPKRENEEVQK